MSILKLGLDKVLPSVIGQKLPASDFFQRFAYVGKAIHRLHARILQRGEFLCGCAFAT